VIGLATNEVVDELLDLGELGLELFGFKSCERLFTLTLTGLFVADR